VGSTKRDARQREGGRVHFCTKNHFYLKKGKNTSASREAELKFRVFGSGGCLGLGGANRLRVGVKFV